MAIVAVKSRTAGPVATIDDRVTAVGTGAANTGVQADFTADGFVAVFMTGVGTGSGGRPVAVATVVRHLGVIAEVDRVLVAARRVSALIEALAGCIMAIGAQQTAGAGPVVAVVGDVTAVGAGAVCAGVAGDLTGGLQRGVVVGRMPAGGGIYAMAIGAVVRHQGVVIDVFAVAALLGGQALSRLK